jgi:hypothetical protein
VTPTFGIVPLAMIDRGLGMCAQVLEECQRSQKELGEAGER